MMSSSADPLDSDSLLCAIAQAPVVPLHRVSAAPPLDAGAFVGQYEIRGLLGQGGMARVYRAWDAKLRREVAVKLIEEADATHAARLEQECRAVAALNHPNVVVVHEAGSHHDRPYVVFEYLQGETLRERLRAGPVGWHAAVDWAIQVARGLAVAHGRGIIHRDLKPENLFLTKHGPMKILDFGLAKVTEAVEANASASVNTEEGALLGTAPYMAPEQVRGRPADHRSDLFALGAILHEMIAGDPLFRRASKADTIAAVLNDAPPPLPNVPPALERVITRCLEKAADDRFQSARDLAFHLEEMARPVRFPDSRPRRPSWRVMVAQVGAILAAVIVTWAIVQDGRPSSPAPDPQAIGFSYHPLDRERGNVLAARFIEDGARVVYSAARDGAPPATFVVQARGETPRDLVLSGARLLAVSRNGELAVLLHTDPAATTGTLATVPLTGGAPRILAEGVGLAEWMPDGALAVVVRSTDGDRIELPAGTTLYRAAGAILAMRASPDGTLLAISESRRPGPGGAPAAPAALAVVDRQGQRRVLTREWAELRGFAWTPFGQHLMFVASNQPDALPLLRTVDMAGKTRSIKRYPSVIAMHDIARDTNFLLTSRDYNDAAATLYLARAPH
jgi:eukaryotic-like serine/threonine-protein kinase